MIRGLVQRATARWITPLSSRTLPGQSCRCRASRASRVKPTTSLWNSLGEAGAEVLGEQLDVGPAVPQRRAPSGRRADPVIEVRAEPPLLDARRRGSRWSRARTGRRGVRASRGWPAAASMSWSWSSRSSWSWSSAGRAPTSSMWSVPPARLGQLGRPIRTRAAVAGRRARGSHPRRRSSVPASSAALRVTKGRSDWPPPMWMSWASSDLPVPGSPTISTESGRLASECRPARRSA